MEHSYSLEEASGASAEIESCCAAKVETGGATIACLKVECGGATVACLKVVVIVAVALFFVHWVATIGLMIPVSLFFLLSCVGDLNIVVGNDIMCGGGVVGMSVGIDGDDVVNGHAWVHNGHNMVRVDLGNVVDGNGVSLDGGVLLLVERSVRCRVLAS